MKQLSLSLMLLAAAVLVSPAHARGDDAEITYVGSGRYTCTGEARACSQVRARNDNVEANRRAEREADQARRDEAWQESLRSRDRFQSPDGYGSTRPRR